MYGWLRLLHCLHWRLLGVRDDVYGSLKQEGRFSGLTYYQLIDIISIDNTICMSGVVKIYLSTISKKKEVKEFLQDLGQFINRDDINIDHDFYLNLKDDQRRDKKYTTSYTTLALEYDNNDIVEVLKTLTVEDYSETKIDTDDIHPPILYVFGKKIDEKLVYIKLKISRHILATSVVQLGGFLINKNIVYACSGNEPVTASYHDF